MNLAGGSKFKVQSSTFKVQRSTLKVHVLRIQVQSRDVRTKGVGKRRGQEVRTGSATKESIRRFVPVSRESAS
jgi:hypothetical protein